MDGLTVLGEQVRPEDASGELEAFSNPLAAGGEVVLQVAEGTSVCPITGQPDYWTATIRYEPCLRCVETKSLKLYLWRFRHEGHFAEQLADIIAQDLQELLAPHRLSVTIKFTVRGGIGITATAVR